MPEFGYDPIPLILNSEKVHTLRKRRCLGKKEITVKGKRTGIIIEFHRWVKMVREDFLTRSFAYADGFKIADSSFKSLGPPIYAEENLCRLLSYFYGEVPETMWCSHFRLLEVPKDNDNA